MLWSFIAVLFSGWLYIDASYNGPIWKQRLFKPITLLLLSVIAWQAPSLNITGYLTILGISTALIGSLILVFSKENIYANVTIFFTNLFYIIGLHNHVIRILSWPLLIVILIIGLTLSSILYFRIKKPQWIIFFYIGMPLLMVWMSGEQFLLLGSSYAFCLLSGAILLLAEIIIRIVSYYFPFNSSRALASIFFFLGHLLIIRSLYL